VTPSIAIEWSSIGGRTTQVRRLIRGAALLHPRRLRARFYFLASPKASYVTG
jgi:hypothetical protein